MGPTRQPDRALRRTRQGCDGAGSELDVVYVQLLALGVIASLLVGFSAWKFRGQTSAGSLTNDIGAIVAGGRRSFYWRAYPARETPEILA